RLLRYRCPGLDHPTLQLIELRSSARCARLLALFCGLTADLLFDRIQLADAIERLERERRLRGLMDVVELSPHVRPARRFFDRMLRIIVVEQPVEAGGPVGLQHALEGLQARARMHACAIWAVCEPLCRRIGATG